MSRHNVFAPRRAPGENALRDALAEGLARVQGSHTDLEAADMLGWSIGTVRNVRNRTNSLSVKLLSDGLHNGGGAFIGPFLQLHGRRDVPLDSACDTDAGAHSRLAKLALKIAVALENGEIDGAEARDMLPELDEWQAHMDRIRRLAVAS